MIGDDNIKQFDVKEKLHKIGKIVSYIFFKQMLNRIDFTLEKIQGSVLLTRNRLMSSQSVHCDIDPNTDQCHKNSCIILFNPDPKNDANLLVVPRSNLPQSERSDSLNKVVLCLKPFQALVLDPLTWHAGWYTKTDEPAVRFHFYINMGSIELNTYTIDADYLKYCTEGEGKKESCRNSASGNNINKVNQANQIKENIWS
jgi:hypothetical protein